MEQPDQKRVERETNREWRRRLQAEAQRLGYSSVGEMLDAEEDEESEEGFADRSSYIDASEILDDHYDSAEGY